ncbi:LytTR family transcriptional regulator DNA-binding domain-containing protein [Winogradskyella sp. 3972H.M.0a.05]|uniref:LytR/AlgR family response regulator transcription factor n=1 Tax=Winogradskyella sp. 3972H.M.0a.05 TaxID=2950277 RepID=UPI00339A9D8D
MAVSCLIIEDDKTQSDFNKDTLQSHFEGIGTIDQSYNLIEAEHMLTKNVYDIILADIHLGDGNVFELLKKIPLKKSKIIFTTSYSEYAIDAFKYSAISYLLKPYTEKDLTDEVAKTITIIDQESYHKQLEVLFYNLKPQNQSQRIVLKNHDLIHVVDLQDIYYAQADNNYTHFYCDNDKKILVSKSLKTFEAELVKEQFFRCHHSYLINLQKIKALHKSADAVILDNNTTIPVATRKKKLLQQLLKF